MAERPFFMPFFGRMRLFFGLQVNVAPELQYPEKNEVMKNLAIILAMIICHGTMAAEIKTSSNISEVIVYTQGAQIEREAQLKVATGSHKILISDLSPFIRASTIQVEGDRNITILSVKHMKDYLGNLEDSEEKKALIEQIEKLKGDKVLEETNISILNEEKEFLKANRYIGGKDETLDPQKFKDFDEYFRYRMREISLEVLNRQKSIQNIDQELAKLQNQLNQIQGRNNLPVGQIEVKVHSKGSGGKLTLRYQVDNAGWYPSYDLRFNSKNEPLQLSFKANVKQGTGVDWDGVKLSVSTAKTEVNAAIPELYPYYLDFYDPTPYLRQSRKQKSMAPAAFGAAPEMALEADDYEPVVVINKHVAVEFSISGRQNIPSENKYEVLHMKEESVKAGFEHQCVPKLSPHVYLVGKISDWYDLNLMDGEVNIFMQNSFVGKSFVNTAQFNDTIDVSFGVDRKVFVKRELDKDYSSETLIGGNKKVIKAYTISSHNQKLESITLKIFDQIPVSKNKEIQVFKGDLAGGKLNESTGKLEWKLDLKTQAKNKFRFDYTIKYPKDKQVLIGP